MHHETVPVNLYVIDYQTREQAFFSPPHRHTVAEIFFFSRGEGTHYIDFTAYPIQDNSVFLLSPQQVHYIEAPANSHNVGYVITVEMSLLDLLPANLRALFDVPAHPPAYQLPAEMTPVLSALFSQLADEVQQQRPYTGQFVRLAIEWLLTSVLRARAAAPVSQRPMVPGVSALFDQFLTCLEANYEHTHSVAAYADRLALTTRQLNRACRRVRGQSALAVIHGRIALEAKRLLFYGDDPIKEIAYRLGFSEPAHFTHFFRRKTGVSPEVFRKQMAQIRK